MPLRNFPSTRFLKPSKPGPVPVPPPSDEVILPTTAPEARSLWRTGLLLATSAAFGGIAVAIWNRRTLAQMRDQIDASAGEE
jgi:hypothetical protein